MNRSIRVSLFVILLSSFGGAVIAQTTGDNEVVTYDFADRQAVATTIQNFYIGDKTGSVEHKVKSLHPQGAYRYTDRDGNYAESVFRPEEDDADPSYEEELLGIEIYGPMALARIRQVRENRTVPEYKVMTLHKTADGWRITSITWGFGVTQ